MVRFRRIEQHDRFFFVTTNLREGAAPFSADERSQVLSKVGECRRDFFLFAYVVMPTHLHLLLAPNGKPLTMIMRNIKSTTGFSISKQRKSPGPIWQERYFDNITRRVKAFWEKVEYIHNNPVAAGLVARPEDWKWSSARCHLKMDGAPLATDPIDLPAEGETLLWPAPYGR